jgi:hypothetical protein
MTFGSTGDIDSLPIPSGRPTPLAVQLAPPSTLLTTFEEKPLTMAVPKSTFEVPGRTTGEVVSVRPSGVHVRPPSVLLSVGVYSIALFAGSTAKPLNEFGPTGTSINGVQAAPPSSLRKSLG